MSSDSDDRVSDHGRQIVESIESMEDVQMEDVDSSIDERRELGRSGTASQQRSVAKRQPVLDNESEESADSSNESDLSQEASGTGHGLDPIQGDVASGRDSDSGDGSGSTKGATGSRGGRGRADDGAIGEEVAAEDVNELSRIQLPPSYQKPSAIDSEFSSYNTDRTDSTGSQPREDSSLDDSRNKVKPRKRKTSTHGPGPLPTDGIVDLRPAKKTKQSLNRAYLDLLNQDIEYADTQGDLADHEMRDERIALPTSQIGLTVWTSMEKERFFEALGRLGRDNTAGIAERVHTKGEVEVRHYMKLLQDALTYRRQQNELDPLGLADFPSAVELSDECCQALEDVADNIAMRQERAEIVSEDYEYGSDWLVTPENCKRLEDEAEDDVTKPAGVFRTKEWLSLSERFFMNAPNADGNWHDVEGNAPSIRLTTFHDFHLLAHTLTSRLVAASHYMAATRIRAESGYRRPVREFVRDKDVHAAALSLGLATQKPPLTRCVRRLGLSVYENPPKPSEGSDLEPVPVTDVEDAFDIDGSLNASHLRHQIERIALSDKSSISSDSPVESDTDSDEQGDGLSASGDADSEEDEEIKIEANEAILYSAVDPPQTKRDRQALHRRIKAEREQERYADAVDSQRSYQEELEMWRLLGQQPPQDLIDPGPPPPGRRAKLSVDAGYSVGRNWRAKTRVISEWEAQYLGMI